MTSFKFVGARVGAQLDRLTELYEESDQVPTTIEGFVRDLTSGSCKSQVSVDGAVEAGIALGVVRGVAIATGIDLVQLVGTMVGPKEAA